MHVSRKLCLIVVDSLRTDMLLRAVADDLAPNFATLLERGTLIGDCVSAFPSVTPVACSEIATGVGPDGHWISGMNWYHRAEQRYVEYGSSLEATRAFGLFRTLYDTVYNMNMAHLSHEVETVFERLGDAGRAHRVHAVPDLPRPPPPRARPRGRCCAGSRVAANFRHAVWGPDELFYGELYASRRVPASRRWRGPARATPTRPASAASWSSDDLYDFLLFSLPDNDHHTHTHGVGRDAGLDRPRRPQLGEIVDAAGGIDAFLDAHAVILVADHAQTDVEHAAAARRRRWASDGGCWQPNAEQRSERAELAVSPTARAAGIYLLAEEGGVRAAARASARPPPRASTGVDLVAWLVR